MSDKIEEAVWETLESLLLLPRSNWRVTDDLVKDIKVDSDDLSFIFVPELEKRLGMRVPIDEWSTVSTVQEVIELLRKYKSIQ